MHRWEQELLWNPVQTPAASNLLVVLLHQMANTVRYRPPLTISNRLSASLRPACRYRTIVIVDVNVFRHTFAAYPTERLKRWGVKRSWWAASLSIQSPATGRPGSKRGSVTFCETSNWHPGFYPSPLRPTVKHHRGGIDHRALLSASTVHLNLHWPPQLQLTNCKSGWRSCFLSFFFWPFMALLIDLAEDLTGNGVRENGEVTHSKGTQARSWTPIRCSEDKASAHGMPAPPTELNRAPEEAVFCGYRDLILG